MPGARCARSPCAKGRKHTVVTTVTPENARHSPRNGFNGFLRDLPGDRLVATVIPEKFASQELDASIGASEPHDFAVRFSAVRQERPRVHRIPSHVRDDRETPLVWDGMARDKPVIWVRWKQEYFSHDDWKSIPFNKHRRARKCGCPWDGLNISPCVIA